jgi:predicted transposase YbfD/YdcC
MNQSTKREGTKTLRDCLQGVEDPRLERTRDHNIIDILIIGVCCLICGGTGFTDMETFGKAQYEWLRRFLALPHGIPSHDTFNRVFSAIKPESFMQCFVEWTQSLRTVLGREIVAVDGKAQRRACNKGARIPYVVSAWASKNSLTLGQVKVDEKSNEITAIPKLLRLLELEGCIVTIDAMGCQTKIAKEIIEADADYVLALKGNQTAAHEEIRSFFNDLVPPDPTMGTPPRPAHTDFLETVEADHGRIETRRYWVTDRIDWFADASQWEGLKSFGIVDSLRVIDGTSSFERRCFLLSLPPDAATFASACRGHWGVENPLHWTLDVTFREDDCRARSGHAPENLAALRRLALNVLKSSKAHPKLSVRSKRLMAAWNHDYLASLIASI